MTGSALRLEESLDGRWFRPGGKYLSTGGVQRGKVTGLLRNSGLADDGKRAKTRRVARWTLVRARREIFINWGSAEGEGDGSAPPFRRGGFPKMAASLETAS